MTVFNPVSDMPAMYQLEWRNGRIDEIYGHRGYYYVFSDSEVLSFLPTPAWCNICGKITLCEKLESPEAIKSELDQLEEPESEIAKMLRRSSTPDFSDRWKRRREMDLLLVTQRTEPASCLTCGGRQVVHFIDDVWMPHPGTGEEVRFSCSGMCSTTFAMKFYDLEGRLLEIDTDDKKRLLAKGYL
jgi:hypothetical protein